MNDKWRLTVAEASSMNELWKDVWIDVYEDSDERNVKL
jgi:hypothetical protein